MADEKVCKTYIWVLYKGTDNEQIKYMGIKAIIKTAIYIILIPNEKLQQEISCEHS